MEKMKHIAVGNSQRKLELLNDYVARTASWSSPSSTGSANPCQSSIARSSSSIQGDNQTSISAQPSARLPPMKSPRPKIYRPTSTYPIYHSRPHNRPAPEITVGPPSPHGAFYTFGYPASSAGTSATTQNAPVLVFDPSSAPTSTPPPVPPPPTNVSPFSHPIYGSRPSSRPEPEMTVLPPSTHEAFCTLNYVVPSKMTVDPPTTRGAFLTLKPFVSAFPAQKPPTVQTQDPSRPAYGPSVFGPKQRTFPPPPIPARSSRRPMSIFDPNFRYQYPPSFFPKPQGTASATGSTQPQPQAQILSEASTTPATPEEYEAPTTFNSPATSPELKPTEMDVDADTGRLVRLMGLDHKLEEWSSWRGKLKKKQSFIVEDEANDTGSKR